HVRSTFEHTEGTWIMSEKDFSMESPVVTSVTHDANTAIFKLAPLKTGTDVLADLFNNLSKKGIVVDVISQSGRAEGQHLAFSVPSEDIIATKEFITKRYSETECVVMDNVAKINIVRVGMRNHPEVAAKFFETLAKHNISIHLVTTSEIKVSAIINKEDLQSAANALHTAFELDPK